MKLACERPLAAPCHVTRFASDLHIWHVTAADTQSYLIKSCFPLYLWKRCRSVGDAELHAHVNYPLTDPAGFLNCHYLVLHSTHSIIGIFLMLYTPLLSSLNITFERSMLVQLCYLYISFPDMYSLGWAIRISYHDIFFLCQTISIISSV